LDGDLKIISSEDKGTVVTFTVVVTDIEYKKMMNNQLDPDQPCFLPASISQQSLVKKDPLAAKMKK
jgi:hypothetical protein